VSRRGTSGGGTLLPPPGVVPSTKKSEGGGGAEAGTKWERSDEQAATPGTEGGAQHKGWNENDLTAGAQSNAATIAASAVATTGANHRDNGAPSAQHQDNNKGRRHAISWCKVYRKYYKKRKKRRSLREWGNPALSAGGGTGVHRHGDGGRVSRLELEAPLR